MKKKEILLVLALLVFFNKVTAQTPPMEKYIVVTFEDAYKISGGHTNSYYWIIPQDSIESNDYQLFRLFLSGFSNNSFNDCCAGKDIDPGTHSPNTSYDFTRSYDRDLDELDSIILKNRKKVQTIVKTWSTGQREEIEVFATTISGKFCSSNFKVFGRDICGYKGKVYIPFSSFTLDDEFWKSDKARFILHQDFSKINFKILPN